MTYTFIHDLPLWVIGVLFALALLAALEAGYRVGLRRHDRREEPDADAGAGSLELTSMFALLGLILAFTYAFTVSRHEGRRQAMIAEANALGTAFLRAGLVAEPGRGELRRALLDYARTRTVAPGVVLTTPQLGELTQRSLKAQARLWPATERVVRQGPPGPIEASLVAAINQVIDMHGVRMVAIVDRLPPVVLWMQLLIAATSLAVAGFTAWASGRFGRWRMTALTLALVGVLFIITDFDRPMEGFIRVSHQAIHALIADMEADLAK